MFIYLFSALTPPYYHLTLCFLNWITHIKLLLPVWGKTPTMACKIKNFWMYCFAALSVGHCFSQGNEPSIQKKRKMKVAMKVMSTEKMCYSRYN